MNDTFEMNTGLAHQLAQAFGRNDWTPTLVNEASKGDFLASVRQVLEGRARIMHIETVPVSPAVWEERDGVIYLSVTSNGRTGPEWIRHLEAQGFRLSKWTKDVLQSSDFKPTTGITYKVAILTGEVFKDSDRITKKIRAEGDRRKWQKPPAEVMCLLREAISDEEIEKMGLVWIAGMHEPIKDSGGGPRLLNVDRGRGGRWLGTTWDGPDRRWGREVGFLFLVSQENKS